MNWPLQDAKNRFSEVVKRARAEGPQTVTLRGARAAVVLSAEDYDRLARDAGAEARRPPIDIARLRALTASLPPDPEPAEAFIRALRDGARY